LPEDLEAPRDRSYLERFTFYTSKNLRMRSDSMTQFKSTRYHFDVDVAHDGDKEHGNGFFVIEIGRWYETICFSRFICGEFTRENWRVSVKIVEACISAGMHGIVSLIEWMAGALESVTAIRGSIKNQTL
jgi:hypothetical protein